MVEVNEIFSEWSEKLNIPIEEFKEKYNEWYSKQKKERPELLEETLKAKCLSYIRGTYSKHFQSPAKNFTCYIIGNGEGYDPFKVERKRALDEGYINDKGKPIFCDERAQFAWRKGKVIPSSEDDPSLQRILYGIFKLQGTDTWKKGLFYLSGRKVNENLPELFVEYKVRASVKEETLRQPIIALNTASVTRFIKVGEKSVDFEKMAEKLFPENLIGLDRLSVFDTKGIPLESFITKGVVVGMNFTPEKTLAGEDMRSNYIDLAMLDENIEKASVIDEQGGKMISVAVSKKVPLDFGVGSELVVVGQKYMRKDKTTEQMVPGYNAIGVYVKYNSAPEEKPLKITKESIIEEEELVSVGPALVQESVQPKQETTKIGGEKVW